MWLLIKRDGRILKSLWETTFKGGWHQDYDAGALPHEWKIDFDLVANCATWFTDIEQVTRYEPEQQCLPHDPAGWARR